MSQGVVVVVPDDIENVTDAELDVVTCHPQTNIRNDEFAGTNDVVLVVLENDALLLQSTAFGGPTIDWASAALASPNKISNAAMTCFMIIPLSK